MKMNATEEFISKAELVPKHQGKRYGYGNVVYVNSQTKVSINCPIHGPFDQRPNNHLNGAGCPRCGIEARTLKRRSTIEEFIIKAKEVHGEDIYGYGGVVYVNNKTPVIIECYIHGTFKQTPDGHLHGAGCPKCGNKKTTKFNTSTTEYFKIKALEVHGDFYEYPDEYVNSKTPILINCLIHGPFQQTPDGHLQGRGCPKCAEISKRIKKTLTTEEFKIKAFGVHGSLYGYWDSVYIHSTLHVSIDCPIHGPFKQTPVSHLQGKGCPKCAMNGVSGVSIRWLDSLAKQMNVFIQHAMNIGEYKIPETRYKADGFCPDINTICEFHGNKTHGNPRMFKDTDRPSPFNNKTAKELYEATIKREKHIKSLGYNLIVIWEDEYYETYK